MIHVLVGMRVFVVGTGFKASEKNAQYPLSSFNTLNEEQRKKVAFHENTPYLRSLYLKNG